MLSSCVCQKETRPPRGGLILWGDFQKSSLDTPNIKGDKNVWIVFITQNTPDATASQARQNADGRPEGSWPVTAP
jgi:hypothetical protein